MVGLINWFIDRLLKIGGVWLLLDDYCVVFEVLFYDVK